MDREWLSLNQASEAYGLPRKHIYNRVRDGVIDHSFRGDRIYIEREVMDEYMERGKRKIPKVA